MDNATSDRGLPAEGAHPIWATCNVVRQHPCARRADLGPCPSPRSGAGAQTLQLFCAPRYLNLSGGLSNKHQGEILLVREIGANAITQEVYPDHGCSNPALVG